MGRPSNTFQSIDLIKSMQNYLTISAYKDIISWCEQNIDFSEDVSAQRNKIDFNLYPYQVPILKQWENDKKVIKTIVVVAPEQIGKTAMFLFGLLYSMVFNPCQSLIVYPSDDLSVDTNQTKLLPLMKHIPMLKEELDKPRSYRADCYKFSNLVSYFQGAGVKIVSKSCKIVIGDEVDRWGTIKDVDNVADLKKRTRSYDSSICFLISTPTTSDGRIWRQFLKGSQGYWTLRCKGCGQLTMRSCDIHNLQFESDLDEQLNERVVRKDSIRLICPKCGHEHTEADKQWMNVNGQYIHKIPERVETDPSFQIGALASQLPSLSWMKIAQAQLESGKRNEIQNQMEFDRSIKGLPYKRRQIVKEDIQRLQDHIYKNNKQKIKEEEIQFVFGAVDSMLQYFRYGIFAMDIHDNVHVLDIGEVKYLSFEPGQRQQIDQVAKDEAATLGIKFEPVKCLEDIIYSKYCGFEPLLVGIDAHATTNYSQVQTFIQNHPKMIGYFGAKLQMIRYKPSETAKCFHVSAKHYLTYTVFHLYSQKNRDNNYIFFSENIDPKYWEEISAVQPDPNSKYGNRPENWSAQNRADHAFDCIKMGYWVRDFCMQNLDKERFNYCQSPRLKDRFEKKDKQEVKQIQQEVQQKTKEPSWIQYGNHWLK